jgi:hypothetical protein
MGREDESTMTTSMSLEGYRELIEQVRDCICLHVPQGAVVLIASKGDEELIRIEGYRAWHFPQNAAGVYAGHHPANSLEAIVHLRHVYSKGAQYLVFPWTARWWLEHYRELANHLDTAHQLTVSQAGVCVIYELRESSLFDAFDLLENAGEQPHDGAAAPEMTELVSLALPTARSSMRVLTILTRFGTDYPHAKEEIGEIFTRQMPAVDRKVVIVDNALPRDVVDEGDGAVLLGGDNSAREFSAFDRALDFVGSDIWSYDLVHFATGAFNSLYVAYLERFDTRLLEALTGRAACVGHVDCYNEPIEVLTYRSQHWMRSCFFFLPPAEVAALGSLVSVADGGPFFSGNPDEPFRVDAPISLRYRQYITQWLTGGDIGQGVEWHSSFALTRDTVPAFEQKARAILNEQLLGIRLRALGCHLVDVTWLSAMLRHKSPLEIAWTTPWREQLASRDRDALVLRDPRLENVGIAV